MLLGGEGLRASSQGVRLRFAGGTRTVTRAVHRGQRAAGGVQHPRAPSLDEAIDWATRRPRCWADARDRHPAGDRALGHRHGAQPEG